MLPGAVELTLAGLVAEAEADGEPVVTVTLRVQRRDDASWAVPALAWLATHGRRPVLRTSTVMPRGLVEAARDAGATVVLELAHHRPEIQRALLGEIASPAAALLLQAQHLRALGVPVAAQLGPLLAGLHDEPSRLEPLLHHVAAADVRNVHLTVGQLGTGRLRALRERLTAPELGGLLRAFAIDPGDLDDLEHARIWRVPAAGHAALYHRARRMAQSHGLAVDVCGCPAQCHLDRATRPEPLPLSGPELFGSAG
jgi:hypothetical protein